MPRNNKRFAILELISALMGLLMLAAVGFGVAGWGMNIYKFAKCDFKEPYKAEIVRGVGIPIPIVGIITGYMDIKDGQ